MKGKSTERKTLLVALILHPLIYTFTAAKHSPEANSEINFKGEKQLKETERGIWAEKSV